MSGLPWSKFFWSDYASDPALKLCSFAAQGLWMRLLCIAAESDPIGYVAVNGKGLDAKGIARITGGSVDEVEELLSELDENSVFGRDRRGWIYSRRLIKDAKKRDIARENGKKGGNPSLGKQSNNQPSDNQPNKGEEKQEPKPQKPEARDSVANATGASAVAKQMFDLGVAFLTEHGSTDKQARSLLGKWRKATSDGEVITALLDCQGRAVSNPVEWLEKRIGGSSEYVSKSGYRYRGNVEDVIRESERRGDMDIHWQAKGALRRMTATT